MISRRFLLPAIFLSLAAGVGCGGGTSSSNRSPANTITTSGNNVVPITVNLGPTGNYADGAFASVTLCAPGTSNCQTIDGVLVDTGSSGLRILSSLITVPLTPVNAPDGNPMVECFPFVSGYTWGAVETADVQIGGEKGSSVEIESIGGTSYPVPPQCTAIVPNSSDTLAALGANGILGVGLFAQDCGGACAEPPSTYGSATGNPGLYYDCSSSGCAIMAASLTQQVPNPVIMFATDNNGVIVELPQASGPEATLSGSLVFGIGTQSNNGLSGATVYTANDFGNFTTTYNGTAYQDSFIDSGSNGYFFLDMATTGIPDCPTNIAPGFYCPTNTANVNATNQGGNGSSGSVSFSVGNAETLFQNSTDAVFPTLGGEFSGDFDWGLPFFFGRNVFVAIGGASTPGGTGPYWAY